MCFDLIHRLGKKAPNFKAGQQKFAIKTTKFTQFFDKNSTLFFNL